MHVGIANPWWRGERFRHSRRMRNPQFYVFDKRTIETEIFQEKVNVMASPYQCKCLCVAMSSTATVLVIDDKQVFVFHEDVEKWFKDTNTIVWLLAKTVTEVNNTLTYIGLLQVRHKASIWAICCFFVNCTLRNKLQWILNQNITYKKVYLKNCGRWFTVSFYWKINHHHMGSQSFIKHING